MLGRKLEQSRMQELVRLQQHPTQDRVATVICHYHQCIPHTSLLSVHTPFYRTTCAAPMCATVPVPPSTPCVRKQ